MRKALIALLAGAATIAAGEPAGHEHAAAPTNSPATTSPATAAAGPAASPKPATLPPFAAILAEMPMISGAKGWEAPEDAAAWTKLASASPADRQLARWDYARGLVGRGRGAEALGVLDVMLASDQDLEMVAAYRLARGAALTELERHEDAMAVLSVPDLESNPEACAWRMRSLSDAGAWKDSLREVNCALPAINGRTAWDRMPFVLAAARAAIEAGQPRPVLNWLKLFPDQHAEANLLRGRAYLALGEYDEGRLRLERARLSGNPEVVAAARLGLIEAGMATHAIKPGEADKQLEALRFGWRGGPVEQRALTLQLQIATDAKDLRGQLRAGAALFRYFKLGADATPLLVRMQAALASALDPNGGVPLPEAAGLYWDYRELAPSGADGDRLVLQLAGRLESKGLYARAAELLQYQLTQRAEDVAQGPLSVKVAALHILSGRPDRALDAIRSTEQPSYTPEMRADRKRMEAVALHQLGKDAAALAAVDGLPDATAIRAEIHWRSKDWGAFASENAGSLPGAGGLTTPGQAAVLRQAVALAMLGREADLQALRRRYGAAFAKLPSGPAFNVLTHAVGSIDPGSIGAAMAAIPSASPAGTLGDLLDASPSS